MNYSNLQKIFTRPWFTWLHTTSCREKKDKSIVSCSLLCFCLTDHMLACCGLKWGVWVVYICMTLSMRLCVCLYVRVCNKDGSNVHWPRAEASKANMFPLFIHSLFCYINFPVAPFSFASSHFHFHNADHITDIGIKLFFFSFPWALTTWLPNGQRCGVIKRYYRWFFSSSRVEKSFELKNSFLGDGGTSSARSGTGGGGGFGGIELASHAM